MSIPSVDPFVARDWQRLTGLTASGDEPGVIVGPMDALNVVECRTRFSKAGFQFGPPSPTDVFLFSAGTAPSRSQTKIGGLPYLSKSDIWPTDSAGRKLPFVAQFNFRDSLDISGSGVGGDILLIFAELPSDQDGPEVELIWKNLATSSLVDEGDVPHHPSFDEFFGTRWRTNNYPHAYSNPANDSYTRGLGKVPYSACRLFATQIGSDPYLLARDETSMDERVLCCLAPVLPAADGPFPFLNEPNPLLEIRDDFDYHYDERYTYVEQWLTWGDSTSLYIFVDDDGDLIPEFIFG